MLGFRQLGNKPGLRGKRIRFEVSAAIAAIGYHFTFLSIAVIK